MCHRRRFLNLAIGSLGLLVAGQTAEAASQSASKKASKVAWYAKVYVKDRVKLIGQFANHVEAYAAGHRWANAHGARYHGETIKKERD